MAEHTMAEKKSTTPQAPKLMVAAHAATHDPPTCPAVETDPLPPKAPACPFRLVVFCTNLFIGLIGSQLIAEWMDIETYATWKTGVKLVTMFCVSYIMIHVGFEFDIDKTKLRGYATEYFVAMTAAGFPWIFVAIYFMYGLGPFSLGWKEALVAARFAAPTSAGILFTMLEAAGMSQTWLFQKARILAIFDDLDTLLLMVPLKALFVGLKWELAIDLFFVTILCVCMYVFLHRLNFPSTWPCVMSYAFTVAAFCELVHFFTYSEDTDPHDLADTVHLEVLLPAFAIGCIIKHNHEEEHNEPKEVESAAKRFRRTLTKQHPAGAENKMVWLSDFVSASKVKFGISAVFMVLVGFSMPSLFTDKHDTSGGHRRLAQVEHSEHSEKETMSAEWIVLHVIVCTVLMNVGKMFPACCYRSEVKLSTRVALAVGMMPRGEVCASIIVNAMLLGITGPSITIAVFCLALNMMMVSGFIFVVKTLAPPHSTESAADVAAKKLAELALESKPTPKPMETADESGESPNV